jgi:Uma2 family endonuclease
MKEMNKFIKLDDKVLDEEVSDMGSLHHSTAQANLIVLLSMNEKFIALPELSLDASQIDLSQLGFKAKEELKPDVCVYRESSSDSETKSDDFLDDDILKVSQMPELVIEILSPTQAINDLLKKIKAYFALGVNSCWLVIPSMKVISVYYSQNKRATFSVGEDAEVVDEIMDIHLPLQKVFKKVFRR